MAEKGNRKSQKQKRETEPWRWGGLVFLLSWRWLLIRDGGPAARDLGFITNLMAEDGILGLADTGSSMN